jgi:signal transduction histidine kinase
MSYATVQLAIMMFSAAITAGIGIYAYAKRRERGARDLAWVMLFSALNACGSILENIQVSLQEKLFYFNLHQSAHILAIPFFLFFVLEYIGRDKLLRPAVRLPILLYFAAWVALLWTDERHHLLRDNVGLQEGVLTFDSTGISLSLNLFGFMAVFAALCYLGVYAGTAGPLARKQSLWVWLSVSLPILWVIIGLVNPLPPLLWGLYTAVSNVIMGLCMFLAVFKFRLLSTVPVAKEHIVEMMLDGVLVTDEHGSVIDCNPSARRMLAAGAEHPPVLAGKRASDLLAAWPRWQNACEEMRQDDFEIEIGGQDSRSVYSVKVVPLSSASGKKKIGTVSVMSDHTEQRRRYDEMEQLNRLKDELLVMVSHDIRDPLAVLLQLTGMLEEEKSRLSEDSGEVLDMVKEKAQNANAIVENVLEWARAQRGGMTLLAQPTALLPIAEEAAALLRSKSEAKGVAISITMREDVLVQADREAVGLVLRNLLANAIKYSHPGGAVSVDAEESGDSVVVKVRDNGIGIEPERRRLLFGDAPVGSLAGTAGERGAGVGLLVSKMLVEQSGGGIEVDSAPGRGSVFAFTLPRPSLELVLETDKAGWSA